MEMQENMAEMIRLIMEKRKMSLQEFSQELEISRSMLQAYLKGEGNPSLKTVVHLGEKMGVEPAILLTGMAGLERTDIAELLLDTLGGVAELSGEKKRRMAELFLEIIQLWSGS